MMMDLPSLFKVLHFKSKAGHLIIIRIRNYNRFTQFLATKVRYDPLFLNILLNS